MTSYMLKNGWYVSEDYAHTSDCLTERNLLNTDIREFGKAALSLDALKGKSAEIAGPVVLQIQKVRNVLSPKVNEDKDLGGAQMLRVTLTDGSSTFVALDLANAVKGLNLKTAPGSKLRLIGKIRCDNGFIMLTRDNCEMIGGHVEELVEKWKLSKEAAMSSYKERGRGGTDAPRWVPFGKIIVASDDLKAGRVKNPSLSDAAAKSEGPSEFDKSRKSTIAEIQATGTASARDFQAGKAQVHEKMQASARQQAMQRSCTPSFQTNGVIPSDAGVTGQKSALTSQQQHQQQKKLNTKDFKRLDKFDIFEDADYEPNNSEMKRPAGSLNLLDFVSQKVGTLKLDDDIPFSDRHSSAVYESDQRSYSDRQSKHSSSSISNNPKNRIQESGGRSNNAYRFDSKPAFSSNNQGGNSTSYQNRYQNDRNFPSNSAEFQRNKTDDRYPPLNGGRSQQGVEKSEAFPTRSSASSNNAYSFDSNHRGATSRISSTRAISSSDNNNNKNYNNNSNNARNTVSSQNSNDVRRFQNNEGGRSMNNGRSSTARPESSASTKPKSTALRSSAVGSIANDINFPALRAPPPSSTTSPPPAKSSAVTTSVATRPTSKTQSSPTANNKSLSTPAQRPPMPTKPSRPLLSTNHPPPPINYQMPPPQTHPHSLTSPHGPPPLTNFPPPPSMGFTMPPPPSILSSFSNGPPKLGGLIWSPGMRCLARHPADGRFCEASIVAPALDHCIVHLQDYNQNVRVGAQDLLPLHNNMPGISFG